MKKFIHILIYIAIISCIYFLVTMLVGRNCDRCGDKIFGDSYSVEGTSDIICEGCAQWLK